MSKIINDVASEYDIPTKSTIIINNDYDNSIKREDKPFIWISEEIFTLKRDKDKLQQENKQLKNDNAVMKAGLIQASNKLNLYKEVIEEVREYIEDWLFNAGGNGASMNYEDINELLQILDKVKKLRWKNNENEVD